MAEKLEAHLREKPGPCSESSGLEFESRFPRAERITEDEIVEANGQLNFCLGSSIDTKRLFNTALFVEDGDYADLYAEYDLFSGQVCGGQWTPTVMSSSV